MRVAAYCSGLLVAFLLSITQAPAAVAETIVIHAGHLIAVPGEGLLRNKSIIVADGRITRIQDGFADGDTVIDLKESWVLPGLIDMHTHVTDTLDLTRSVEDQLALAYLRPPAEQVLDMLPTVKHLLNSGFTSIRNLYDPSSTTYALRDAINKGTVVGPRMFATEPQVSVDGGDLDPSTKNVRQELRGYVSNRADCTGADECRKVVRREIRRGADVIKLRQSGLPVADPNVNTMETEEELEAIIDTAHALDRKVAAHVIGTPAYLHMVIRAGVDTIEHGPLDKEAIRLMKRHGTSYTPTLLAAKMIDYRFEEAKEMLRLAYQSGVNIVFGTDLGIVSPEQIPDEFALMIEAGIPAEQVLRAATVNAAKALGRGETMGSIAAGKYADIIAVRENPIENIRQLGDPEAVVFVMKDGRVLKD